MFCLVLVEICRLVGTLIPKWEVVLPFYSTLIPFALICFFSREARILCAHPLHVVCSLIDTFFCRCVGGTAVLLCRNDYVPSIWSAFSSDSHNGVHYVLSPGIHRLCHCDACLLHGSHRSKLLRGKISGSSNSLGTRGCLIGFILILLCAGDICNQFGGFGGSFLIAGSIRETVCKHSVGEKSANWY